MSDSRLTDNHDGGERCRYCDNQSLLVVGFHVWAGAEYDEMGPCPFCVKGARAEFGIARTKEGADEQVPRPPWGKAGFWQGRPPVVQENAAAGKPFDKIPDWVCVWRFARARDETRVFPQQAGVVKGETMSQEHYEDWVKVWEAAGKPSLDLTKLMGAVLTAPSIDDVLHGRST